MAVIRHCYKEPLLFRYLTDVISTNGELYPTS